MSLRGGSGSGRRGNPSCLEEGDRVCLFAYWFTVDRHGLRPRDDKSGGNDALAMTTHSLSLRGGSVASDAAIHRVSGDPDGFVSSLTGSQWIATGFQPSRPEPKIWVRLPAGAPVFILNNVKKCRTSDIGENKLTTIVRYRSKCLS